jgi:hypothetical protein
MMTNNHVSEVARIRAAILAESIAAERGLSGSRDGTARHDFISKRQAIIEQHYEALASMMPRDEATGLVIVTLAHAETLKDVEVGSHAAL